MEKVLSDKKAICIFILPALLVFSLIVVIPIIMSFYYSLLQWDGIGKSVFIGIENYKNLIIGNRDGFLKAVSNSLLMALLCVIIQLPLALIFALILARGVKGENFYRTVYFIPVILSTVVIGQLWMKIYHPSYGLLNILLKGIGLESLTNQWLGNPKTALMAVIIPIVWQYIGYHMLLMYASAKSIPEEIFEAARIDGASGFKTAIRITIPLIKPIIKVCLTFAIIGSLKIFDIIFILTNGGPVHASEVPSTLMYNTIFQKYLYGYGSAMAVFIVIECLIFTVVIKKLVRAEEVTY